MKRRKEPTFQKVPKIKMPELALERKPKPTVVHTSMHEMLTLRREVDHKVREAASARSDKLSKYAGKGMQALHHKARQRKAAEKSRKRNRR